jgi:c-di-AMP phosphodiesterase-like protein
LKLNKKGMEYWMMAMIVIALVFMMIMMFFANDLAEFISSVVKTMGDLFG